MIVTIIVVTFPEFGWELAVGEKDVVEGLFEGFEGALADGGGPEAALPDDYGVPAETGKGLVVAVVALAVALYLRAPEVHVGLGEAEVPAAFVAVPEATVDEDTGAVLAQDDVRVAGQTTVVKPVAEAARTVISGLVSAERMAAMFLCRC